MKIRYVEWLFWVAQGRQSCWHKPTETQFNAVTSTRDFDFSTIWSMKNAKIISIVVETEVFIYLIFIENNTFNISILVAVSILHIIEVWHTSVFAALVAQHTTMQTGMRASFMQALGSKKRQDIVRISLYCRNICRRMW